MLITSDPRQTPLGVNEPRLLEMLPSWPFAAAGAEAPLRLRTLGLHRLEADVDSRNHASIRCLERLGFRREGYARERYHLYGTVHDSVLYGLLRRELTR